MRTQHATLAVLLGGVLLVASGLWVATQWTTWQVPDENRAYAARLAEALRPELGLLEKAFVDNRGATATPFAGSIPEDIAWMRVLTREGRNSTYYYQAHELRDNEAAWFRKHCEPGEVHVNRWRGVDGAMDVDELLVGRLVAGQEVTLSIALLAEGGKFRLEHNRAMTFEEIPRAWHRDAMEDPRTPPTERPTHSHEAVKEWDVVGLGASNTGVGAFALQTLRVTLHDPDIPYEESYLWSPDRVTQLLLAVVVAGDDSDFSPDIELRRLARDSGAMFVRRGKRKWRFSVSPERVVAGEVGTPYQEFNPANGIWFLLNHESSAIEQVRSVKGMQDPIEIVREAVAQRPGFFSTP
ncbi:MAG: hypothetical protein AAF581_10610 [Planctomycetota bacterium]